MTWHTTFGEITLDERLLYKKGGTVRPFLEAAGVTARGCSLPLERRAVDLGADVSFAKASEKFKEHYGVHIAPSTLRLVVEKHGRQMAEVQEACPPVPVAEGAACLIAEADGSMVPQVSNTAKPGQDGRKHKSLFWKEVRLCMVATPEDDKRFGAVLGSVEELGDCWERTAIEMGLNGHTRVHCLGDGAPWVEEQARRVFGERATFLLDFYHVSDYLSAASWRCARRHAEEWLKIQQERLKQNLAGVVCAVLAANEEPEGVKDKDAPVRCALRYLSRRRKQLDYAGALSQGLPIGSGEIEGGNRSVVQARLKLPGAWWEGDNVRSMLALSLCRANDEWDGYWENQACKKAA